MVRQLSIQLKVYLRCFKAVLRDLEICVGSRPTPILISVPFFREASAILRTTRTFRRPDPFNEPLSTMDAKKGSVLCAKYEQLISDERPMH